MQQKPSDTQRIFIEYISLLIGADVHTAHIHLTSVNLHKGFLNAAFSHANGFYLRAKELDARLVFLINKIIMVCLLIVRNQFNTFLPHGVSLSFQS